MLIEFYLKGFELQNDMMKHLFWKTDVAEELSFGKSLLTPDPASASVEENGSERPQGWGSK